MQITFFNISVTFYIFIAFLSIPVSFALKRIFKLNLTSTRYKLVKYIMLYIATFSMVLFLVLLLVFLIGLQ